jgi:hypothetical protein
MAACIATILSCWLCALLATPRRPRRGNEVEVLVYTRLLGRRHLLVGLAAVVTVVMLLVFVLSLPRRIDRTLGAERQQPQVCVDLLGNGMSTCYTRQSDGMWAMETLRADGNGGNSASSRSRRRRRDRLCTSRDGGATVPAIRCPCWISWQGGTCYTGASSLSTSEVPP